MNTIAIDSNIYKGAESYAKLHNISVTAVIEKAISLFLQKVQPKQKLLETAEFNDALSYVKTLKAKGGKPIPADENSLDAKIRQGFDSIFLSIYQVLWDYMLYPYDLDYIIENKKVVKKVLDEIWKLKQ